jgi:hypothetical protein
MKWEEDMKHVYLVMKHDKIKAICKTLDDAVAIADRCNKHILNIYELHTIVKYELQGGESNGRNLERH